LRKRERRVFRIHLGADIGRGLAALGRAIEAVLSDQVLVK
jgi:hypothetical protein